MSPSLAGSPLKAFLACCFVWLLLAACGTGYAASTYEGHEDGAAWRKAALERIEKIRKSGMTVLVVDSKGRPVQGAQVKVTMQQSAFGFGEAVKVRIITGNSKDAVQAREALERDFNTAVFENDLKWGPWESGPAHMGNAMAALRWMRERGINMRGHCVAWAPLEADDGTVAHAKKDGTNFRAALLKHAGEEVRQVGDLVSEWDVANHPLGWGGKTIRDVAGDDIYDTLFRKVKDWNPRAARFINEGGIIPSYYEKGVDEKRADAYYELIDGMLKRGVPVQGIGFMGHFFAEKGLTPPRELLQTLDRFAALGLPLKVTEFDVRYGKAGVPVEMTPEQEQLQADYTRDFLIAMFSHPAVTGVVTWGFWEGSDWYTSTAMYRKDWSPKPNGLVWEDLVLRQWRTKTAGLTDTYGRFATRGFLGYYLVEAAMGGKKGSVAGVSLGASGTRLRVVVE